MIQRAELIIKDSIFINLILVFFIYKLLCFTSKQANMIQKAEYLRFRFDGVPFQARNGFYPHKNRSLEGSATLNVSFKDILKQRFLI